MVGTVVPAGIPGRAVHKIRKTKEVKDVASEETELNCKHCHLLTEVSHLLSSEIHNTVAKIKCVADEAAVGKSTEEVLGYKTGVPILNRRVGPPGEPVTVLLEGTAL